MTITVVPKTTTAISDNPADASAGKVVPSVWNAGHQILMATARLLGRVTAAAGAAEEIAIGADLIMDATSLRTNAATAVNYRAATADKVLQADDVWSAAVPTTSVNLTGTVTLDFSTFLNHIGLFTGNVTLGATSNLKPGQMGIFEWNQNTTGGWTLSVNSTYWALDSGTVPAIATTASAKNRLAYYVQSDGKVLLSVAAKAVA